MGAAIELENVSKRFRLYHDKPYSLKERVIRMGRMAHEEFWALRDVDLDIGEGETVGLIGHNGSGKSTLLKCVAGILRPTNGRIRKRGRIAALLELGAGFHPDLTGRENVYLNGSILGLSRAEVDRIFDDIVAFAELEPFIDNQVKHYSSGMYARLGFAVAVNVEPEILLVDEVLAVGDEAFQRKCLDRITRFQIEGRTILLVSHMADLVRRICDRAAVLDHGRLIALGPPGDAVLALRESLSRGGIDIPAASPAAEEEIPSRAVCITGVDVDYPVPGRRHLVPGEPLALRVHFDAKEPTDGVVFALAINDQRGNVLLSTGTDLLGFDVGSIMGAGTLVFELGQVPLLDGSYELQFVVTDDGGAREYDHRRGVDHFQVVTRGRHTGLVHFDVSAHLDAAPGDATS